MKYLRLTSGIGFWIEDNEASGVARAIYQDGKSHIVIQGNVISSGQVAGIFNEVMGDRYEARERGLILRKGKLYTKNELLGLPLLREKGQETKEEKEKDLVEITEFSKDL